MPVPTTSCAANFDPHGLVVITITGLDLLDKRKNPRRFSRSDVTNDHLLQLASALATAIIRRHGVGHLPLPLP